MKYKGMILADLHMGAIPFDTYESELQLIYDTLEETNIDYLIIAGDYFHKKMYINDPDGNKAISWFLKLVSYLSKKYPMVKVRIVYGTESHDSDQYEVFYSIPDTFGIDFKVIKTVREEELFPDFHVLYLPEEHINDKQEYYKDFFNNIKKYNYIFGHGVVEECMSDVVNKMTKSTSNRKKVPIFKVGELSKICKGEIYFGHYHIASDYGDFHYVGSFSRWRYGEEEPKGFYITKYDMITDEYTNKFIINENAQKYTTYEFKPDDSMFNDSELLNTFLDRVKSSVSSTNHIRIKCDIPEDNDKYQFCTQMIKEKFKHEKDIKVTVPVKKNINNSEPLTDDEKSIMVILFDRDKLIEDKISEFISLEFNKVIPSVEVKKYLDFKINSILNINM